MPERSALEKVQAKTEAGSVAGYLAPGVAPDAVIHALCSGAADVLAQRAELVVHAHARPHLGAADRAAELEGKLERMRRGTAKRYVLRLPNGGEPLIVKIAEVTSLGNAAQGLFTSVARKEHHNQVRAQSLDLAASRTLGYLELRRGPRLIRAAQVQSPVDDGLDTLETFLSADLIRSGDQALDRLGTALAATHAVPFFHADLKGFHAFVDVGAPSPGASYRLRWLDLARVGFRMTRRRRVINLYQALRFVIPQRAEAQERFIASYCRASGWYGDAPDEATDIVRRFLEYKYRTHPVVE
jgi:hypothetical protein